MKMNHRPRNPEGQDSSPSILSRKIPLRWILIAIVGYMMIYNLILWFNSRG